MSRKLWITLAVVLVVAMVATCLVGCNDEPAPDQSVDFTVTIDYNYAGATARTLRVNADSTLDESLLTIPTREGYIFDGWYLDAAGETPLTFASGKSLISVTTDITVYAKWKAIALESITVQYVGGEKAVGDALSAADFSVTATYTDGATRVVTDVRLSATTVANEGDNVVILTYAEAGVVRTASVTVVGTARPATKTLEGIRAQYLGQDLTVGEEVNVSDVIVTASYSDNTTSDVTDFTLGTYDNTLAGDVTITVAYQDKTATFTVTYVEAAPQVKALVSISAVYEGQAVEVGGSIALADVVVTAVYSDGSTASVTDFTLGAYDNTQAGDVTVTVSYRDKTATVDVTFFESTAPTKELVAIRITYRGGTVVLGQEINRQDIEVMGIYDDESESAITDFTVGEYDEEDASEQEVTVSYLHFSGTIRVTFVEGEFIVSPETRTVYFTNNKNWDSLKAYAYNSVANKNVAEWPGEDLDYVAQSAEYPEQAIYSYTFSVSYDTIIFNSGDDQTVNIVLADLAAGVNAFYLLDEDAKVDGKWAVGYWTYTAPIEKTLERITAIYVGGSIYEGSDIALSDVEVVAYYDDGSDEVVTSGYSFEDYDKSVGTREVTLSYAGKTASIEVTFVSAPVSDMVTVYFFNSNGWDTVNAYGYDLEGGKYLGEWGGAGMTNLEDGWFSVLAPKGTYNIIFNNGSAKSRVYAFDGTAAYYAKGVRYDSKEAFDNDLVTCAMEVGSEAYPMTLEDGQYVVRDITIAEAYAEDVRVFVNDYTADFAGYTGAGRYNVFLKYENETWTAWFAVWTEPFVPAEETQTIYFTNDKNEADVYAYVWVGEDEDKHEFKAWAERDMATYVEDNELGQKVWSYTFSVSYANIIFTFGEEQTVDIVIAEMGEGKDGAYPTEKTDGAYAVGFYTFVHYAPVTLDYITAEYTGGDIVAGGSVNKADITVTAYYTDESSEVVEDFEIGDYDNVEGKDDITITYEGKTDVITVTFVAAPVWEASEETQTIYFTNDKNEADVYAYVWVGENEDKHEFKAWAERDMATYVEDNELGQKVWSYTFSVSYANIIFTFGEEQTVDIVIAEMGEGKDGAYPTEKTDGAYAVGFYTFVHYAPVTLDHITVAYNGGDIEVDGEIDPADVVVTAYYTDETSEIVTEDITLDYDASEAAEDVTVTVTYGGETATFKVNVVAPAPATVTVYFTNNGGWIEVYAYLFTDKTPKAEWPGDKMTFVGQNDQNPKQDVYSITFLASYESIIFSNGLEVATQTVDIALSSLTDGNNAFYLSALTDGKYQVLQWECDPDELTQPATLVSITAEYTGDDVVVGGSVSKSDITVTAYYSDESIEVVEDFEIGEYDNVEGKDDITITYQGFTDVITVTFVAAPEWNGVISIDVEDVKADGNSWFENDGCVAYVYVKYTDATDNGWVTSENAESHRATRTEAYKYTFQTDADKTIEGIVIVRGKADGSAMYNKSAYLADEGTHHIAVTAMVGYGD